MSHLANDTETFRTTSTTVSEPVQLVTTDPIFGTGCQACCSGNVEPTLSVSLYSVSNVSI